MELTMQHSYTAAAFNHAAAYSASQWRYTINYWQPATELWCGVSAFSNTLSPVYMSILYSIPI